MIGSDLYYVITGVQTALTVQQVSRSRRVFALMGRRTELREAMTLKGGFLLIQSKQNCKQKRESENYYS